MPYLLWAYLFLCGLIAVILLFCVDGPLRMSSNQRHMTLLTLLTPRCYERFLTPENHSYIHRSTESLATSMELTSLYGNHTHMIWLRNGSHKDEDISYGDLITFIDHVLPYRTRPFTLVCTDGDNAIPGEYDLLKIRHVLNHPLLVRFYAQNRDRVDFHPKLRPLPIGINAHDYITESIETHQLPDYFRQIQKSHVWSQRKSIILVDVLNKSHTDRERVEYLCRGHPTFSLLTKRMPVREAHTLYASHKYVLSVRGNGLDCHRTWECVALGCVVIVCSSPLDSLYHNIPAIHIVDSWNDLLNPTFLSRLEQKYQNHQPTPLQSLDLFTYMNPQDLYPS